jgi:outer membrane protein TolC
MINVFILFLCLIPCSLHGQADGTTPAETISLEEAIKTGLLNNPEIKQASENINAAKGRFWSGISLPPPEVNVEYEFIPDKSGLSRYDERTIQVSQSFALPYEYILNGVKYNTEKDIAYSNLKQAEIKITSAIKSAYYSVLEKQEQLRIAEENLVIAEEFSSKADIRYNTGEGTNLERLTAKVQYSEAVNNTSVARNKMNTALAELNFVMGTGNRSYRLSDSLAFIEYNLTLQQILDLSNESNQLIKSAELNVKAISAERGLAWTSFLPGFSFAYSRQSRPGNNNYYGMSFGVSIPLWFMFDQRGRIQETSANVSIAETGLRLVKDEVSLKIKNAFSDYENNFKQVQLYREEILPQADEIYRTAYASYDAGEISYLEYLQARQTLVNSKSNYINILYNYNAAIAALEEAVGARLKK